MPLAQGRPVREGDHPVPLSHTNDNEEWRATIRHIAIEGALLFRQLRHGLHSGHVPLPGSTARRRSAACRISSARAAARGGSLRPLCDPARLGPEAIICADLDLTQVPRSRMEFDGLRPLRPAGRAEADRGRPVTEMPKEGAPL